MEQYKVKQLAEKLSQDCGYLLIDLAKVIVRALVDANFHKEAIHVEKYLNERIEEVDPDQLLEKFTDISLPAYKVGDSVVFNTTQSDLRQHNGKVAKVVEVFEKEDEKHDAECLPMFSVQIPEGEIVEAFSDELTPTFYVDIPQADKEEFLNVGTFSSKEEAYAYAQEKFGADESGNVSLISQS